MPFGKKFPWLSLALQGLAERADAAGLSIAQYNSGTSRNASNGIRIFSGVSVPNYFAGDHLFHAAGADAVAAYLDGVEAFRKPPAEKLPSLRDAAAKILDAYREVDLTGTHALDEAINELAAALDGAPAKTPPAMALNTYVVSLTRQVIRYQTLRVEGVEAPDEDTAYAIVKDMPQYGEVEWKYTGEMQDIGATDVEVTGPRGCIAWRED